MLTVLGGNSASTGYNLTRSLRFRSSASAYLNRTYVASPTDYRKYTFSAWVKLGALGVSRRLIDAGVGSDTGLLNINATGSLNFTMVASGVGTDYLVTNNVLRDPSAWYHIVFSCDTSVASNQFKFYINNIQASYSTNSSITLNYGTYLNSGSSVAQLGRSATYAQYFDGYMTEINFIDGQALTPSSFGSTNTLTGVWQPARYTGTYGTNGFYLPFTDNSALTTSSNVGLGKDFSGNGNYWATNNISITAGTTYDSMTDVPTLTSATAANFAVLNPLNNSGTLANANLTWNGTDRAALGTMALPITGKYYFEATCTTVGNFSIIGIADGQAASFNGVLSSANFRTYNSGGEKADSTRTASWGSTFTSGDVIGIAVDMDNGAIYFAKNNTWQASGVPTSGASKTGAAFTDLISSGKTWVAFVSSTNNNGVWNANHGQRPFAYTPPTGFVALNTFNLPTSTIVKGNTVMDATLYTGDGTTPKSQTNAAGFKPDFVWIKSRSSAYSHNLFDSVRGAGAARSLQSDNTKSEADIAVDTALYGYLSAFNSNGFSTTNGVSTPVWVNASGSTYVAWQWQAGQGSSSSNTNGTITSTVSVNASAGFSVVTYTGTGANATVGHGLGVAPSLIIVKARNQAYNWNVYSASLSNQQFLRLNTTDSVQASALIWNATTPTSSVFSLGAAVGVNGSGDTHVAYCWTPIAGFSAFGSYTGNGSADGSFVYTGFQPKWIMVKASSTTSQWVLWDAARNTYNVTNSILYPNLSAAEASFSIDILSNGFKFREAGGAGNDSGVTYIYAAFATSPFKNSLAR